MRFVLAIVAFVFAAVMIVLGIAQRTVLLEPSSTSMSTTVEGDAPYTVIDSSALSAHPGSQTLTVSGSDTVFMAYGRTADIRAWLGGDDYVAVTHKDGADSLRHGVATAQTQTPAPIASPAPTGAPAAEAPAAAAPGNPAGSDLWLDEFTAEKSLTTTINVPEGISVILASDGTKPAPGSISISWPIDNSTPWAGPLIAAGAALLLIGLVLYLWALLHLRRSRGPRRNLPSGPRMPRLPRPPRPKSIKASQITGRKSITRSLVAVVPVMLVSGLVLSGCSADFWPKTGSASTPSAVATPQATAPPNTAESVAPPAVTVPQLERIVRRIAVLTKDADATLNADAIATRFTGPALEQRVANYKIRAAIPDYAAAPALPASPLRLTLPQQASGWPRVVFSVIQNPDDPTVAPTAILLRQESARSNYLIEYAVQLEAAAKVPGVAPATIGAPIIPPDSNFLLMAPDKVAAAYADVLMQGEASPSYSMFQVDGDTFRTQVGVDKKNEKKAALPTTASIEFATSAGSGKTTALATNDSGAIVAVSLTETETVKPVDAGATVSPEGASKALSGVSATAKGIQSSYGDQLLFHVPAAGSKDKIVLLGFAQGLTSSAELP
ncbi:hypothetical protein [Glaciibacter sp. 2TAF33]|uniref:hypothetical protein n=1 Tax=Glaciibacter sp. 2TAF33 TaxID=3233015 RepID=UPI003F93E89C